MTEAQRTYLRLVDAGLTSKEIAQQVGGSHHTINVEIGIAMRVLAAKSRREAAAMLTAATIERSYEGSYEPKSVATPDCDAPSMTGDGGEVSRWPLPVMTNDRPTNTLTQWQRIGWILVLATLVALLLGGLVSGITALLVSLARWF